MTMIDNVQQALRKYDYFYKIGGKNYIKLYDTPRIWGMAFNDSIMPASDKREAEFQDGMMSVLGDMRYRCDITSLNAPDKAWRKVILDTLDKVFSTKIGRTEKPQIRFLFAQTTSALLLGLGAYFNGTPEYLDLKNDIVRLIEERGHAWECIPEIWIGRFYRIVDGLVHSLEEKLLPPKLVSPKHTKMTWNHTKIVAVDGYKSFVGGHNLNMDLFKNYPPVHDVSVKVLGDAPLGAQLFLNGMWETGKDLLTREYLDPKTNEWVNLDKKAGKPADPFNRPEVMAYVKAQQTAQTSTPPKEPGYQLATKVMSVGKYWTGPDIRTDYKKASEIMKECIIKTAKRKICMSQQDIVSAWKKSWKDHHVCNWLLEALLANPELEVQIVVSAFNAAAGAAGDQYSFGSGAIRTFELMKYYMTHDINSGKELPDPDGKRANALKRIKIAPFFYTDQVPETARVEGKTYFWPNTSHEAFTATLKAPLLTKRKPKGANMGHPFISLLKASGFFLPKVAPAPGNHAKVTIIDDSMYVVGSDNMYPGYHSEFNYLIEGEDAVSAFIKEYWEPLWEYASPQAVTIDNLAEKEKQYQGFIKRWEDDHCPKAKDKSQTDPKAPAETPAEDKEAPEEPHKGFIKRWEEKHFHHRKS